MKTSVLRKFNKLKNKVLEFTFFPKCTNCGCDVEEDFICERCGDYVCENCMTPSSIKRLVECVECPSCRSEAENYF